MSIYATLDGEIAEQLASNRGWSDFGKWADSLDPEQFQQVVHVWEHGWSQDLKGLRGQLARAVNRKAPDRDTLRVVKRLTALAGGGADVLTVTDGLAPSKESFCGGPGSGQPGPCPEGAAGVDAKRATILDRAKALPRAAVDKAVNYAKGQYARLEARYGRRYAVAIMGAGLLGVPLPVPGASLATALPIIGVAEWHRRLSGAHAEEMPPRELTPAQIRMLGRRFMRQVSAGWSGGTAGVLHRPVGSRRSGCGAR